MALIILSWVYISFIFFCLGLTFNSFVSKKVAGLPEDITNKEFITPVSFLLVGGLVITAIIGSIASLFLPLSYGFNLFLLLLALLCLFYHRRLARTYWQYYRKQLSSTHFSMIAIFIIYVFIFAYLSALPSSHYDDGLYYSTTIKWSEEYGVVKGIANINPRIGFNSNWHLLNAIFSFSYMNLGNFNDLNALLLLLVFPYSLGGLNQLIKGNYDVITLIRAFFMIPVLAFHFGANSDYIFYNVNFLSSSTPDLSVCLLLWTTFIWLFELDFIKSPAIFKRQAIYIILVACFLFTVKPSSAPVLIIVIWFFFLFLKKKQFLFSAIIVGAGLIVIMPWLIRNIFITGYLVFPFSAIDVFNVDWKIPLMHAQWHENAVRVYAINTEYDLNKPFTIPLSTWFPVWFDRLRFMPSLLFLVSIMSLVVYVIIFLINIVSKGKGFLVNHGYKTFTFFVITVGIIFWFFKGPDFRFGYGFIGIFCSLSIMLFLKYFLENNFKFFGCFIIFSILLILGFNYHPVWKAIPDRFFKKPAARQMPEKIWVVTIGQNTKINVVPWGASWYAPLPVANDGEYSTTMPVLRGVLVKDGFKATIK